MKWVLIAAGVLAGAVALTALIGALLPRSHVAASAIVVPQPPDTVWQLMRDVAGLPGWWPDMRETKRVADSAGREVWQQTMKQGFVMRGIITESVPPARFVSVIDTSAGGSFGGSWTYEIAPVAGGSRVRVTERGWIANPIFRFMSRFIFGYYGSLDSYLTALGKKLGASGPPEHQPADSAAGR